MIRGYFCLVFLLTNDQIANQIHFFHFFSNQKFNQQNYQLNHEKSKIIKIKTVDFPLQKSFILLLLRNIYNSII